MTALERLLLAEAEYLREKGWEVWPTPFEGIIYWAKPSDLRTNGVGIPQLTAVIWQRQSDDGCGITIPSPPPSASEP